MSSPFQTAPPLESPSTTSMLSPQALDLISAGTLILTPALLLLPPRRLNLSTLALATTFGVAADYQLRTRTGQGTLDWLANRRQRVRPTADSAAIASPAQAHLPHGSPAERQSSPTDRWPSHASPRRRADRPIDPWTRRGAALGADGRRIRRHADTLAAASGERGTSSTWQSEVGEAGALGSYGLDWKTVRGAEERDAEARGEGVADRIVDQIWDVVNQKHRREAGGGDSRDDRS